MDKNELLVRLEEEKDHSAFLEKLLRCLYGDGWDKLTIFDAKEWHQRHIASQPAVEADELFCGGCEHYAESGFFFCPECGTELSPAA